MNKNIFATLLIFFITIFIITASLWSENRERKLRKLIKNKVPVITVSQLKDRLSGTGGEKPLLLDTRERDEFDVSRLKGARFCGYKGFQPGSLADVPKTRPIVVYCSLGVRSENIGLKLKKAGFTDVRNLLGGLFQWVNLDNPVYDSEGKVTQKVHAYSKKWGKWLLKGTKVFKVISEQ